RLAPAAVGFARRSVRPGLVRLLALPLRVDEVAGLAGDRTQQLETEEARGLVHRPGAGGEPPFELRASSLGHLDSVDLHDCHTVHPRPAVTDSLGDRRGEYLIRGLRRSARDLRELCL